MRCCSVALFALLALFTVYETAADRRDDDAAVGRGPAVNGTDDGSPRAGRGGHGNRGAGPAEPRRGQRCSVQPAFVDGDALVEGTQTVDRYRVKPAVQAYYARPAVYRERPAAVAYVLRRRPVATAPQLLLLQPKTDDEVAAVRYNDEMPAAGGGHVMPWPERIGPPPYVPAPDGGHRPTAGEPLVSLTTDQVRRVLQRMFSEGVMAGEAAAAAAGPKFIKV